MKIKTNKQFKRAVEDTLSCLKQLELVDEMVQIIENDEYIIIDRFKDILNQLKYRI